MLRKHNMVLPRFLTPSMMAAQYSPDGGYIVFMSDRDNATGTAGAANMDMGFDLYLVRVPLLGYNLCLMRVPLLWSDFYLVRVPLVGAPGPCAVLQMHSQMGINVKGMVLTLCVR